MYAFYIDTSIHQIGFITPLIERLKGILYTDSRMAMDIIEQDFPSIRVKYYANCDDIIHAMKKDNTKFIILQDFHYKKFSGLREEGVKFVQIFHGMSDKTYNLNREIIDYHLVCLSGKMMLEDVERRGLNKKKNCIVTGNLKTDMIFNNKYERTAEIKRLGLDPGKKTILYAPTWMDGMGNSSFKKFGIRLPEYFPDEYQLTIKLHPNLHLYRKPLVQQLKRNIGDRKTMILLENGRKIYDIVRVMAASDILITDVSGVSHEYIAFLRPMIFLNNRNPLRILYGKKRTRIWTAGDVVSSLKKLPEVIRNNVESPDRYRKIQEMLLGEIYSFTDGKTVDRIISAMNACL